MFEDNLDHLNDQKTLNALLRSDFSCFIQKSFSTITGSKQYMHNWHIEVLADALQKCFTGETKRLIINIAPRYLKSICGSVAFSAWILGHKPNAKITAVSYNENLADGLNRDTLTIMKSSWYKELFPATQIDSKYETKDEFKTTAMGGRFSTSIGGTLTGKGGEFILIDDPLKSSDAKSKYQIDKVNEWFCDTLITRSDNKSDGVIILIMQRLAEFDLTGFLLSKDTNKIWTHVNIPVIAENDEKWICKKDVYERKAGDALQPERESLEHLQYLKQTMGTGVFAAQYQQNPLPAEGNIIKQSWIQRYDELPIDPDFIVQGWDTAMKTGDSNDYSACVTCFVKNEKIYLAHVFRGKLLYPDLKRKVVDNYNDFRKRYPECMVVLGIENKSSGISLIDDLKEMGVKVESVDLKGNKQSRVYEESAKFENGRFMLPKEGSSIWLVDYEDELIRFPYAKNDDQIDATVVTLACCSKNFHITPVKPFAKHITTQPYRSINLGKDMRNGICDSRGRLTGFGKGYLFKK